MAGLSSGGGGMPARRTRWPSPVPLNRPRVEIIPLIDVMFFLLAAFMMVSLSLQKAETFRMTLPVATTAKADFKAGMFNIGIERDGRISVEKRPLDLDELERLLRERLRERADLPVYVTADKQARHADVSRVLGRVRATGVMKVAFVTDPPER